LFCATPPLKFPSKGGVAVERSETDGVVKNGKRPPPAPSKGGELKTKLPPKEGN